MFLYLTVFFSFLLGSIESQAHHRKFSKKDRSSIRYSFSAKHHSQSTGKSYQGRELAEVMGAAGIPWLDRPQRQKEEDLLQLVESLGLKKSMRVADIGAGSGVLSLMMAKSVGKTGMVYAVDIQKEMLHAIKSKAKKAGLTQVKPVLGSLKQSGLKAQSIDLALMVDVYHEFSHPYEMMDSIIKSLKIGGRIALVEYRGEDPKVPIKLLHKMTLKQIKKEYSLFKGRLKFSGLYRKLPRQHLVFYTRIN